MSSLIVGGGKRERDKQRGRGTKDKERNRERATREMEKCSNKVRGGQRERGRKIERWRERLCKMQ